VFVRREPSKSTKVLLNTGTNLKREESNSTKNETKSSDKELISILLYGELNFTS
jgi:hypothetical protein